MIRDPRPRQRRSGGAAPSSPGVSSELQSEMEKRGIRPGVSAMSVDDPMVWDGTAEVPRSQVYQSFYAMSPGVLRNFQEVALKHGAYGPNATAANIPFGMYDSDTLSIWKNAVDAASGFLANGRKITPFDALGYMSRSNTSDPGAKRAPFSATVADPAEIKEGLRAAAKEIVGSDDVDEARLDKAVAAFQARQVAAQRAAYDTNEAGGVAVGAPDFGTFAEQEARKIDPLKADARASLKGFDVVRQMFSGGG